MTKKSENTGLGEFRIPLLMDSRRLVGLFLALALAFAAGWGGLRGYRAWRHGYLLHQAETALTRKDFRSAVLCARQALASRPTDRHACRVMAEIAEALDSREAIFWRGHVAASPGATVADRLAWASAALRFDEMSIADHALLSIPPASKRTAQFHTLAGMLAVDVKDLRLAEFHFASACQLDPTNDLGRLNLATVRLHSGEPRLVEQSHRTLAELKGRDHYRLSALRALLSDALQGARTAEATRYAEELAAAPSATWQDHLQLLSVLHGSRPEALSPALARLQQEAVRGAPEVAQTALWMVSRGMGREALAWVNGLPTELSSKDPVPMALAEMLAATSAWEGLKAHVSAREWPGREELRLAWLARSCRELGDAAGARRSWKLAVSSVASRPMELVLLARLAKRWGWNPEAEDLFWILAGAPPYQRWALQQLFVQMQARGDTRGLKRVMQRALELDPTDRVARNNLALYSLLLHSETDAAFHHAEEVYQGNPSNAVFTSTWAFALHQKGRTTEGLRLLETLPEKDLRQPSIAAYRGILMAAMGNAAAAQESLSHVRDSSLLPEERELVAAARRSAGDHVSGKRSVLP